VVDIVENHDLFIPASGLGRAACTMCIASRQDSAEPIKDGGRRPETECSVIC
jgi:hypothetical protein